MSSPPVLVMDNGAGDIKAGFATDSAPRIFANCVARSKTERKAFVGDQILAAKDLSALYFRRPFDRGYCTNWEMQRPIWDRVLGKEGLQVKIPETCLMVTEPMFNLPELQRNLDELVFEDIGFGSYYCANAPQLAYYHALDKMPDLTAAAQCSLVIDAGYSFTHVVPVFRGVALNYAAKRINIGGKALTNHLKELISYRQWNMMDETMVINAVKERLCFVSQDFDKDMRLSRKRARDNQIKREYILPTDSSPANPHRLGAVKEKVVEKEKKEDKKDKAAANQDQIVMMGIERFSVPELLYRPSHIGVEQAGIPEVIIQALDSVHVDLRAPMLANIQCIGGCSLFPNFVDRLTVDVRQLTAADHDVNINLASAGPLEAAWHGGTVLAKTETFHQYTVTKAEYDEKGSALCRMKFGHV